MEINKLTMDNHRSCLENMCRICGNRAQTAKEINNKVEPKLCIKSQEKICVLFGIDIKTDDSDIHPKKLCKTCFNKLKNMQ